MNPLGIERGENRMFASCPSLLAELRASRDRAASGVDPSSAGALATWGDAISIVERYCRPIEIFGAAAPPPLVVTARPSDDDVRRTVSGDWASALHDDSEGR